jgi:hypothetical protein
MDYALSDGDINAVLGEFKPILYSELVNYNSIEDLLRNDYDWRIILIETKQNSGHWTCIMRVPNKYYYFNSYGQSYNKDLYLIPKMVRKILGQSDNYLNELLRDKNVEYNAYKLQGDTSAVCGRYVMFVIDYICNHHNSLQDTIKFIKNKKKELGLKSYDETIIALTNKVKPSTIPLNLLKSN